jgi:hypothetical protein
MNFDAVYMPVAAYWSAIGADPRDLFEIDEIELRNGNDSQMGLSLDAVP